MSVNITSFSGTPGNAYSTPGTLVQYGQIVYNTAGTGIRPVPFDFSQLVDVIPAETSGYIESVIDFSGASGGAEVGFCFINGDRSGFSLIITSSSLVLRKEVAAVGGSTISSLSTSNSGTATFRVSITLSTGAISVTKNSVEVLTGTYTDISTGLRPGIQSYISGGTGPSYTTFVTDTGTGSARTIDSIGSSGVVTLGAAGSAITTTGLGTLTSLTIGGVAVTALSATGGDGTFTAPAMADGLAIGLVGASRAVIAGDGTNTASSTCTLALPAGWSHVTLSGTLNTSASSPLYNASPAVAVGDQIVGETSKITLYASLDAETDYVGTQTLYHIDVTDNTWRSFTLTTGTTGGVNVNLTGASSTAALGAITASLGGAPLSVNLTGVGATATTGSLLVSITAYIVNAVSGSLPTFLVESVSKLRKTFRKSFRKK